MTVSFVAEAHNSINYLTTMAINVPTGTSNNDLLVAVVATGTATFTPTGWTLLTSASSTGGTSLGFVGVYWKLAASEPASYTWNMGGGSGTMAVGGISCYRGVDQTTPIDQTNFNDVAVTAGGTSYTETAVTCNGKQVSVAWAAQYTFGSSAIFTWTEGSGNERADFGVANTGNPDQASMVYNDDIGSLAASGSVGRTVTCSGASSLGCKGMYLINAVAATRQKSWNLGQSVPRASTY